MLGSDVRTKESQYAISSSANAISDGLNVENVVVPFELSSTY